MLFNSKNDANISLNRSHACFAGREAKPCYPLTPAAIISASGGSKEERERAKQEPIFRNLFTSSCN
jgi:hypothetical protein